MSRSYSTYEAKSRFSEVLRQVRAGQRIVITHHGKPVAEVRKWHDDGDVASRLKRAEEMGTIVASREPKSRFSALVRRPGALLRFLNERD